MNDLTVYESIKDKMKTADLLAWKGRNPFSLGICYVTGEPFSHVGLIVRMSEYEGLERRRFTSEAAAQGVFPCFLRRKLEKYHGDVWWYPLKKEYDSQRAELGVRAAEFWGMKYDFLSIAKQLVGRVSVNARYLFCSEYVQIVFQRDRAVAQWPGEIVKWPVWDHPLKII